MLYPVTDTSPPAYVSKVFTLAGRFRSTCGRCSLRWWLQLHQHYQVSTAQMVTVDRQSMLCRIRQNLLPHKCSKRSQLGANPQQWVFQIIINVRHRLPQAIRRAYLLKMLSAYPYTLYFPPPPRPHNFWWPVVATRRSHNTWSARWTPLWYGRMRSARDCSRRVHAFTTQLFPVCSVCLWALSSDLLYIFENNFRLMSICKDIVLMLQSINTFYVNS